MGSADNYSSSSAGEDSDDKFKRVSGRKQGLDQPSNRGTMDSATSSMLGGVGRGQGSWYFQPQYGTQLYGTQYTAVAGAVAGAPPPLPRT